MSTSSEIYELTDTPGGGHYVTFKDPVDGWPMHLIYGQTPAEASESFRYLDFNFLSGPYLVASM